MGVYTDESVPEHTDTVSAEERDESGRQIPSRIQSVAAVGSVSNSDG